ncbi:MAG: hypothetical protein M1114_05420 [Candidatus Dependentiae bacterium]|nr:hypothetical protein [Candidatus Dependentiae bacterium]
MKLISVTSVMLALVCIITPLEARRRSSFVWPTGSYHAVENNVAVSAHILSTGETAELFDGYGKSFIKGRNSIIPYKIEIFNGGEGTIIVHDADIGLPLINVMPRPTSKGSIAKAALFGVSVIGGALAGGFIGLVGGSLIASSVVQVIPAGGAYAVSATNGTIAALTMGTLFGSYVGARICYSAAGYMYSKPLIKEYQLAEKVAESAMHSSMMIKPNEAREFIVFTSARDAQSSFALSLDVTSQIKRTIFPVNFDTESEVSWVATRSV